ncbi:hypothetical protein RG836_11415 [Pseudomonas sp. SZMC_28357]|uniref:hypothetical protein n=1 Tax=Pseudomonas sp. SZMC_28357 TaxID=3074380 RepID=UPI002872877D|nr:hypothetical protein [Pseudomonas sp. SZMC_28357]MDR9752058.1 hypothetical protein [Pseudomonas sp. SZMC_28357]
MQSDKYSNYNQCAFDATSEMLALHSHFFPIFDYFSSVSNEALTFQENALKASVLRNYAELESEYQRNLSICFGECHKVRPLLLLTRPKLDHQITLRNAWSFTFDAFGSVEIFMAGLGIRVGHTQKYNLSDFHRAKQRVSRSIRELYIECQNFIERCHIAHGNTPEYAFAVIRGVDIERVLD